MKDIYRGISYKNEEVETPTEVGEYNTLIQAIAFGVLDEDETVDKE